MNKTPEIIYLFMFLYSFRNKPTFLIKLKSILCKIFLRREIGIGFTAIKASELNSPEPSVYDDGHGDIT